MIIAIDIGGTKIAAALVDETRIIEHRVEPSVIATQVEALVPLVVKMTDGWIDRAVEVRVATTGLVTESKVRFLAATLGPAFPLRDKLQRAFEKPVAIMNDAWAAAWGEFITGDYESHATLAYLTVSTGIGGGLIIGGQLVTGTTGIAAHLGHTTVSSKECVRCSCGRDNCVETIASGTAIARRASDSLGRSINAEMAINESARNPLLADIVDDAARAVAEVMINAKAFTDTPIIVLGGSVGLNDTFRALVEKHLAKSPSIYAFSLLRPQLGRNAELIGAATADL